MSSEFFIKLGFEIDFSGALEKILSSKILRFGVLREGMPALVGIGEDPEFLEIDVDEAFPAKLEQLLLEYKCISFGVWSRKINDCLFVVAFDAGSLEILASTAMGELAFRNFIFDLMNLTHWSGDVDSTEVI